MTTLRAPARRLWRGNPAVPAGSLGPALLLIGLAGTVGARWLAVRAGLDPLAVGAGFGIALVGLWVWAARVGVRAAPGSAASPFHILPPRRTLIALGVGVAFGLALAGGAILGGSIGGFPVIPGLGRPAAPFVPWAAITLVVASAEEGILRGVLFDRLRASGGTILAIAVTTVAFALLHVPLYGWHVVPLDLAVGLAFAGLRLSTGSIVAPVAAHAVADLATWWL